MDGVPKLPKGLVIPTVVAGLNGIGRGQDRAALMEFVTTVAQGMGPEVMMQYIDPSEFLRRLAAASGIESSGIWSRRRRALSKSVKLQQNKPSSKHCLIKPDNWLTRKLLSK